MHGAASGGALEDEWAGAGRQRVGDDKQAIQAVIRRRIRRGERRNQILIAKDLVAKAAQQIPFLHRPDPIVSESFFDGKPDLATGKDVERIQTEVAVSHGGLEVSEQLLVRHEDPAGIGQNISA